MVMLNRTALADAARHREWAGVQIDHAQETAGDQLGSDGGGRIRERWRWIIGGRRTVQGLFSLRMMFAGKLE